MHLTVTPGRRLPGESGTSASNIISPTHTAAPSDGPRLHLRTKRFGLSTATRSGSVVNASPGRSIFAVAGSSGASAPGQRPTQSGDSHRWPGELFRGGPGAGPVRLAKEKEGHRRLEPGRRTKPHLVARPGRIPRPGDPCEGFTSISAMNAAARERSWPRHPSCWPLSWRMPAGAPRRPRRPSFLRAEPCPGRGGPERHWPTPGCRPRGD
jgi:hypothetical protein